MRNLARVVACGALIFGCASGSRSEGDAVVQRWQRSYNSHDFPSFIALYEDSGSFMPPPVLYPVKTSAELRTRVERHWRTAPGIKVDAVHDVVVEGEKVAFRWVLTLPKRGQQPARRFHGATFWTLRGGRIHTERTVLGPMRVVKNPAKVGIGRLRAPDLATPRRGN